MAKITMPFACPENSSFFEEALQEWSSQSWTCFEIEHGLRLQSSKLGIPISTAAKRLSRARSELRRLLGSSL
jgi:hypothetical protein